jgi:hypothetical protein
MSDPWAVTVDVLAGRPFAGPPRWPPSRTRRVELFSDVGPPDAAAAAQARDTERQVLARLGERAMSAGEVAYALGISLESAYRCVSRLHAQGVIRRSGRLWQVAEPG